MKKLFILSASLLLAASIQAAPQARTYQVTGPVLELTDTTIVVQKGDEKWEVARDKDCKVDGDLKLGSKVTIKYRCVATSVEVKGEKADKPVKVEKADKPAKK